MTSEAETMVERIARALLANDPKYDGQSWRYLSDTGKSLFRSDARAVLSALLDPTEEMVWAHEMPHIGPDEIREMWRRMIQAALQPGSEAQ